MYVFDFVRSGRLDVERLYSVVGFIGSNVVVEE